MCHVLIIEDEWLIADYIEHIVRDLGATSVEIVDCERDAVNAAEKRLPEIILADVNLREGTGPHAVETILKRCGRLPVIFITATPNECIPCNPPSEILSKPIMFEHFAEKFRRLAPVV